MLHRLPWSHSGQRAAQATVDSGNGVVMVKLNLRLGADPGRNLRARCQCRAL